MLQFLSIEWLSRATGRASFYDTTCSRHTCAEKDTLLYVSAAWLQRENALYLLRHNIPLPTRGGIVEKQNTVVNTTKRRRSTNIVEVYFHGTHDSKVLSMHFRAKSSAAAAAATPAPRHKHCIPTKTTEQHRQYYDYYYYYYCYTTTGRSLSSSCAACAHYHYALLVSITDTMQRHSFDCWASFSPSFCSA